MDPRLSWRRQENGVENKIKDKEEEPFVECIFIEQNPKTFDILEESVEPYDHFVKLHKGDCNKLLPKILDEKLNSSIPLSFHSFSSTSIHLNWGSTIEYDTISKVMARDFTELFIHFSWEGVPRMAGHLRNVNHPDPEIRKLAQSNVESLNNYMTEERQEIQRENSSPSKKRKRFIQLYERKLKENYSKVQHIEIPVGASNPSYYLFTYSKQNGKENNEGDTG